MNEQKKILFYEEGFFEKSIHEYDPILSSYLDEEKKRQQNQIEMIASENFTSEAVMQAQGSVLTKEFLERIPAGRLGEVAEVAELVAFLVGDLAGYITGETIHINGGMYMN